MANRIDFAAHLKDDGNVHTELNVHHQYNNDSDLMLDLSAIPGAYARHATMPMIQATLHDPHASTEHVNATDKITTILISSILAQNYGEKFKADVDKDQLINDIQALVKKYRQSVDLMDIDFQKQRKKNHNDL